MTAHPLLQGDESAKVNNILRTNRPVDAVSMPILLPTRMASEFQNKPTQRKNTVTRWLRVLACESAAAILPSCHPGMHRQAYLLPIFPNS